MARPDWLPIGSLFWSKAQMSKDVLCQQLKSNQTKLRDWIKSGFPEDDPLYKIVAQLSGNNLMDMGRPYVNCRRCPSKAPKRGHANFGVITQDSQLPLSDEWQKIYGELPIEWPKKGDY